MNLPATETRNAILEIRPGVGGDEAELFAFELFRMYLRFAERKNFKTEIATLERTPLGGLKLAVFKIKGPSAYSLFKNESGVHRVQRIPKTEKSGRIHTSTATVAVLPEITPLEIQINPSDLRIDTFRASGAGGQYVQKTESAVRITHLPTGITVSCQDERSQLANKEKALTILRSKLFQLKETERQSKLSEERKNQIGTGERSEKIRTYNFPQDRVTDHRINKSWKRIDKILDGDLDAIINALVNSHP